MLKQELYKKCVIFVFGITYIKCTLCEKANADSRIAFRNTISKVNSNYQNEQIENVNKVKNMLNLDVPKNPFYIQKILSNSENRSIRKRDVKKLQATPPTNKKKFRPSPLLCG